MFLQGFACLPEQLISVRLHSILCQATRQFPDVDLNVQVQDRGPIVAVLLTVDLQ